MKGFGESMAVRELVSDVAARTDGICALGHRMALALTRHLRKKTRRRT